MSLKKSIGKKCYPYNLPVINALKNLGGIEFKKNVTFFIGENGCGKSTLTEAIAVSYGFNPEGGSKNFNFNTYKSHSDMYRDILLSKSFHTPKDGYFLRSESFYNVATNIAKLDEEPAASPLIKDSYGGSLHGVSHGESFMALMNNRLGGQGVYIFDEPEAALSINRQFALLYRINELVKNNSQFIIATHSPILLAFPNALIYSLDNGVIKEMNYEQTDNYILYKRFLNNHTNMIGDILGEDKP